MVVAGLRNGFERSEALLCPRNLEFEDTDTEHVPRDPFRSREHDALRVQISNEPGADPIIRIDGEIGQTGELGSQSMRNRGLMVFFEEMVLLSTHRFEVLDVGLVRLLSHWKLDHAGDR